ncbi:hypothetical protein JB92DRAFT_826943 [Gautieria morchelliformis]|nr:hypothetical protein JB92DRAFT_826943 [Gautieria morchelliformis]
MDRRCYRCTAAHHPTRHTWVLLLTTTVNVNLAFRHLLLAEGHFAFSMEHARGPSDAHSETSAEDKTCARSKKAGTNS